MVETKQLLAEEGQRTKEAKEDLNGNRERLNELIDQAKKDFVNK